MKLVSANIGSMNTNQLWKSWQADVTCLQETRVGKTNHKTTQKNVEMLGLRPVFGDLLPGHWHQNGTTKTPCGGTAILGSSVCIEPFMPEHDQTGLYCDMFKTKRVVAAWYQVTRTIKGLFFSVYATTGASGDASIHAANDTLFEHIFLVAAQFGNIPIAIAGDFQAHPLSYSSISCACQLHGWIDPLTDTDHEGHLSRPYTYSKDCTFSGADEGCSSIDGVLLNHVAFCATKEAKVLEHFGRQRRPIQVTFEWSVIQQVGYVLCKFAPLDVSAVPCPKSSNDTRELWNDQFALTYDSCPDIESKWSVINDYFQSTLINKGANWGKGPRQRAQPPKFLSKRICPSQLQTRCAATKVSLDLYRLIHRLDELFCRLSRVQGNATDVFNTRQLAIKAHRALAQHKTPVCWQYPCKPTLTEVYWARRWAENFATTLDARIRLNRIRKWKAKIKQSEHHGHSFIFQHLRNKSCDEPPNLVVDSNGNIITQPEQAIANLNEAWDSIFAANVLADHPLKMLETIWPYIQDKQIDAQLPPISGPALFQSVHRRKANAAPGLDGWRTVELQSLPKVCFDILAEFFQLCEESDQPLPEALTFARQIILNKPGPASPINKRLITILPPLLLAYTGTRYNQLQEWQMRAMPPAIVGGVKGRYMATLYNDLRLDLDCANQEDQTIVGVKLDKSKAFDRIIPQFAACLFISFGLPQAVVKVFLKIYQGLHKHMAYRNWTSPVATTHANGVAQGCSFSILAMNAYNKVWYHLLEHFPQLCARAYIDDSYLWCHLANVSMLQQAIQVTEVWDKLAGQQFNPGKSSMWSNTINGRQCLRKLFPQFPIVLEFDTLGTRMYSSSRSHFGYPENTHRKILTDIDHIAALPVSMRTRIFLVGSKVVPKITFGSHISRIPKVKLEQVQNAIVRCIWGKRPKWRSKWLVQAVLATPHRTDPRTANAYHTVFKTIRACHSNPEVFRKLTKSFACDTWPEHSLCSRLQHACDVLNLQIHPGAKVSFQGSVPVEFSQIPPQDAKKILQAIARNSCYHMAGSTPRKDFHKTKCVFDHALTSLSLRPNPPAAAQDRERWAHSDQRPHGLHWLGRQRSMPLLWPGQRIYASFGF